MCENGPGSVERESKGSLCIHCKSEIHKDATYCSKCHLYQDRRRYFWVGTTTLSLLIALITVIGFISPKVGKVLYPPTDALLVNLIECGGDGGVVSLVVSNTGERAGSVRSVVIHQGKHNAKETDLLSWPLQRMVSTAIVKSGESIELVAASYQELPDRVGIESATGEPWHLIIEVVRASGKVEQRVIEFQATSSDTVGIRHPAVILHDAKVRSHRTTNTQGNSDRASRENYIEFAASPRLDSEGIQIASIEIDGMVLDEFQVYVERGGVGQSDYSWVRMWQLSEETYFAVNILDETTKKISQGELVVLIVRDYFDEEVGRINILTE